VVLVGLGDDVIGGEGNRWDRGSIVAGRGALKAVVAVRRILSDLGGVQMSAAMFR